MIRSRSRGSRLIARVMLAVFLVQTSLPLPQFTTTERVTWTVGAHAAQAAPTPFDVPPQFLPPLALSRTVQPSLTDAVVDGELTLRYVVENRSADRLDAVLLRTTLDPGLGFVASTPAADRSGGELAIQLGALDAGDRITVAIEVQGSAPYPTELDSGAQVFAMRSGRPVGIGTEPVGLVAAGIDPALLACTIDANCEDPEIQRQAALLGYDPTAIFAFVRDEIGYEPYSGSLRGARGTLWSRAGNALDQASLLVALLRASGIPARYAEGSLDTTASIELIRQTYPDIQSATSFVPTGQPLADPESDADLQTLAAEHAWVELDAGAGFQSADPSFEASLLGDTRAPRAGGFTEVPDARRHKVRLELDVELRTSLDVGLPPRDKVLDETYASAELVGRPVVLGHFVRSNSVGGFGLATQTHRYQPYLLVRGLDGLEESEEIRVGSTYEEVFSTFVALGNQIVTGAFTTMTSVAPDGSERRFERALVDRIGLAVRNGGGTVASAVAPDGPAIDLGSVFVLGSRVSARDALPAVIARDQMRRVSAEAEALREEESAGVENVELFNARVNVMRAELAATFGELLVDGFERGATDFAAGLSRGLHLHAYPDRPQLTMTRVSLSDTGEVALGVDIVDEGMRSIVPPDQAASAGALFNLQQSLATNTLEGQLIDDLSTAGPPAVTGYRIVTAAAEQGIPLLRLDSDDAALLDTLAIDADAKARMAIAIERGLDLVVPAGPVELGGDEVYGWLEFLEDAQLRGRLPDGSGGATQQYAMLNRIVGVGTAAAQGTLAPIVDGLNTFAAGTMAAVFREVSRGPEGIEQRIRAALKRSAADAIFAATAALPVACIGAAFVDHQQVCLAVGAVAVAGVVALLSTYLEDPPLPPVRLVRPFIAEVDDASAVVPVAANVSSTGLASLSVSGSAPTIELVGAQSQALPAATRGARVAEWSVPSAELVRVENGALATGAVRVDDEPAASVTFENGALSFDGTGSQAFYAGASPGLGGAANWQSAAASVSGASVRSAFDSASTTLDGVLEAPGRFEATGAASGVGPAAGFAASFDAATSITVADASVRFGPLVGASGWPTGIDPTQGVTLVGADGQADLTAGASAHALAFNGAAADAAAIPSTATEIAEPGTSFSFPFPLQTTSTGDYELLVRVPVGWGAEIAGDGAVTIHVGEGAAPALVPVQLSARAIDRPELVVHGEVVVDVGVGLPAVALEIVPDPLYALVVDQVPFSSSYLARIQNRGPSTETFTIDFPVSPTGFRVETSRSDVTLAPGERAEVGLYLSPDAGLPAPGTVASFETRVAGPSGAEASAAVDFTVGDVSALRLSTDPEVLVVEPGGATSVVLEIAAIGNTGSGADLSAASHPDLSVVGLPPSVSLGIGGTQRVAIDILADAAASAGTDRTLTLGADLCQGVDPSACTVGELSQTTETMVEVRIRSAAVLPLAEASLGARDVDPGLAGDLDALAGDLQLLVNDPDLTALCVRVQRSSLNLAARLRAVPALASLAPSLDALAASAVACDPTALIAEASGTAATLLAALEAFTRGAFAMSITPPSVLVGPTGSADLTVRVENEATEAQTIALSTGALPAGADLSGLPADVTLEVGEGVDLPLTLTHPTGVSATFPVTIDGSSGNAPVAEQANAIARVLPALAEILALDADPRTPAPGTPVAVAAELQNTANAPLDLLADVSLLDEARQPLASNPTRTIPVALAGGGAPTLVDLGSEATAGLDAGVYYARLALRNAADGSPAAPAPVDAPVVIGGLIEASVSVDPAVVPPGAPTVTTTVTLETANAGNSASSARLELLKTHFDLEPNSRQVVVTPIVVDLDLDGFPEIVFGTYQNFNLGSNRFLRAITTRPRAVTDENLARYAIAWGESDDTRSDVNPPRLAHDGDLATFWRTVTDPATENQVFEMFFGGAVTVRQVNLLARGLNAKAESGIFDLLDMGGSVLATSGDILATPNGNDRDFLVPFPETSGVYGVRFTSTDLPGSTMRINEFEVIGDAVVRGDEVFAVAPTGFEPNTISEIAAADIDGDGFVELLVRAQTSNALVAFEHDGTPKWNAPLTRNPGNGAPAVADLDGDGVPEIVIGSNVLDADGNLLWAGPISRGEGTNAIGALSFPADVDLDGTPEIVAGRTLYEADGTVAWDLGSGDGTNAVGNFDADPEAEIVFVRNGTVSLYEHDGTLVWGPVVITGFRAGPPTVADFDADGELEIGVASAELYTVLDTDGTLLWDAPTVDGSSSLTGSTVFDFEGDGAFEVVYGDEEFLRVYRGSDGTELAAIEKSSRTRLEMPVVADADGDGNAEILAAASSDLGGRISGVMMVGGADAPWRPTRQIWNQHAYHVTNVNEDGSIPADADESWLVAGLNTFRSNEFSPLDTGGTVTVVHALENLAVDAGSIDPAPAAATADEITWELPAVFATAPPPLRFDAALTAAEPGSVVPVSGGTTVDALITLGDGSQVQETIELPPVSVAVASILQIAPGTQSIPAGDTASYDLTVTNPSGSDATIGLAFAGVPDALVSLPTSVLVPANDAVVVPLQIAPPFDAATGLEAFAVTASFPGGGDQTASAELLIEAPIIAPPVLETRAVSLTLVGSAPSAGPGTVATAAIPGSAPTIFDRPSLRVANLGTTTQTYDLALAGPAGWSASLDRTQVEVAPGLVNAIDVPVTLVAPLTAVPGSFPFSATATDTADAASNDALAASVVVQGQGIALSLTPPSGVPESVFDLTVTNTGSVTETFDLVAGGAASPVTTGLPPSVTLAAGASQVIPLDVGAIDFALPGAAALVVQATARTQPSVFAQAQALLTIAETRGLGLSLTPSSQTLDALGSVDLEVSLANQGTLEDQVTVRVLGTSGPISASLRSPLGDGLVVSGARLPGGALGILGLEVTILGDGAASVTVEVRSELDTGIAASDTANFTIALPQPPSAVISAPAELPFGQAVVLDGTGSSDADGGPDPLSFSWTLLSVPPGSALTGLSGADAAIAGFDPDVRGVYEVQLEVDDGLFTDTASATIEVVNNAPVADAGPDQNVETGASVSLDGSDSFDPDGDLLSYAWSFVAVPPTSAVDDTALSDPASPMPAFETDVDGSYTLALVVNDGFELVMDTVLIDAATSNVPPNADAGPDRSALVGLPASVDGSASNDPDAGPQPLTYAWRFVALPAGSALGDADLTGADTPSASFVPDTAGDFEIELTVDDGGASDTATVRVSAAFNAPPMADAGADREVIVERAVRLDGSASSDPDDAPDALFYAWRFVSLPADSALVDGDIIGADGPRPTVTFDAVGTYVLELEVFDGLANDFDNVAITVIGAQQMVHYETANEQSVLDPITRIVTSTADLSIRNDGSQRLRAPWQLSFALPSGVTLVDADGSDAAGRPFYDLEEKTGSVELRPGETLVVAVAFEHPIGVAFTYDVALTELSAQVAPQQSGTACGLHAEQALFLPLWFAFRRFWRRRRAAPAFDAA